MERVRGESRKQKAESSKLPGFRRQGSGFRVQELPGNRKQETGNRYRLPRLEPSTLEQFLFPVSCFLFPVPFNP
jgi:hypothetical protein